MPGTFSESNRPRRPGAYFNFVTEQREIVSPSQGGVAAIPFVGDWGPFEVPVRLTRFDDYLSIFGDDRNTEGYRAIRQAFVGEGLPGRGGVGEVIALRYGGAGSARARIGLTNANGADAADAHARYHGARGNRLSIEARPGAAAGQTEVIVRLDNQIVERFRSAEGDVSGLAAEVNRRSDWFTLSGPGAENPTDVEGIVNDAALDTPDGPVVLAGGDNGTEVNGGDVTRVTERLAVERFGLLYIPIDPGATYGGGISGEAILTSIAEFSRARNARGQRFITVVGGPRGETAADANARSEAFASPDVVNCGVSVIRDDVLGELAPWQWAARVVGILASRGEARSISFARMAGVEIVDGVLEDEIESTFDAGTIILTRDNHTAAPVRIERALTTYQGGDPTLDVRVFGQPKYVRTLHGIEMEVTEYVEANVIGNMPINESTRESLVAEITARALSPREDAGVIQPGATLTARASTPADAEYLELDYAIRVSPSVEQVFNTVRVQRSNV